MALVSLGDQQRPSQMRTLLTRSLIVCFALTATLACKKKTEFDPPCLINTIQTGTSTTTFFHQNGKVVKSVLTASPDAPDTSLYFYADDRLSYVLNPALESFERKEYVYDSQGRLATTKGTSGSTVVEQLDFFYSGNNAKPDSARQTLNSGGNIYLSSYYYTWVGGNLTRYTDNSGYTDYTYDSYKNPKSLTFDPSPLVTTNNVATSFYSASSDPTHNFTYQYNAEGYPTYSAESNLGQSFIIQYTYSGCD
jgi:hypothetical protein